MASDVAAGRLASGALIETDVVIVGGGPAGLTLSLLLDRAGIANTVLERRSRAYVEGRIRAGVLEAGSVRVLEAAGAADRLHREGLVHAGFAILDHGRRLRISLDRDGGPPVVVYGQTEVTKDLVAAKLAAGGEVLFESEDVALHHVDGARPEVTFVRSGASQRIACRFIAGCDGFHGVSRHSIPAHVLRTYERVYPFGWLGVLADVPPCDHELIYARSARGFALASMRSATRSRYYVQCRADEDLAQWPDGRFWDELALRLGPEAAARITTGPAIEKSIAPLRSFVAEPMRYGNLFLAGDAAHIVPPTGAKGLNLALGDVALLARAFERWFKRGDATGIDRYSAVALDRVWKCERFSWWMTSLLHDFGDADTFEGRMRGAELAYVFGSSAAQASLAENYSGLPLGEL